MSNVTLERAEGVATITVRRPKQLNSLDAGTLRELRAAALELSEAPPRVLLLQTEGDRVFSAGADIEAMSKMTGEEARSFSRLGHDTMDAIEALPCVVLGVVQGAALGGGFELALACDLLLAGDRAKFGLPETNLALIPGFGGNARLLRRIGPGPAREMVFSGRIIDVEEATALGIVARRAAQDELVATGRAWAEELAERAPLALRHAKAALAAAERGGAEAAARLETDAFASLFSSADTAEGLSAFLGKRKPTFHSK